MDPDVLRRQIEFERREQEYAKQAQESERKQQEFARRQHESEKRQYELERQELEARAAQSKGAPNTEKDTGGDIGAKQIKQEPQEPQEPRTTITARVTVDLTTPPPPVQAKRKKPAPSIKPASSRNAQPPIEDTEDELSRLSAEERFETPPTSNQVNRSAQRSLSESDDEDIVVSQIRRGRRATKPSKRLLSAASCPEDEDDSEPDMKGNGQSNKRPKVERGHTKSHALHSTSRRGGLKKFSRAYPQVSHNIYYYVSPTKWADMSDVARRRISAIHLLEGERDGMRAAKPCWGCRIDGSECRVFKPDSGFALGTRCARCRFNHRACRFGY